MPMTTQALGKLVGVELTTKSARLAGKLVGGAFAVGGIVLDSYGLISEIARFGKDADVDGIRNLARTLNLQLEEAGMATA